MRMFLERLNDSGIRQNKYWYDYNYNRGAGGTALPNCTCYCVGRVLESYGADSPLVMFNGRNAGGFPDAKYWLSEWKFDKGIAPKVGGVLVWGKPTDRWGHVAFVERVLQTYSSTKWKVRVSQSNYGGVFWELKDYIIEKGKVTSGIGYVYQGCCYNPNVKIFSTTKYQDKQQVEVLIDMLSARQSANGVKLSGLFCPPGLYNILGTKSAGAYTWAQLDSQVWIALNDTDGWTKTYIPVDKDKQIKDLEGQVKTLNTTISSLNNQLATLKDKITKATKSLKG